MRFWTFLLLTLSTFKCQVGARKEGETDRITCLYCVDKCEPEGTRETPCTNINGTEYMCISSFTIIGGHPFEQKGCVKFDQDLNSTCNRLNQIENSSCKLCDSSYCNSVENYTVSVFLLCVSVVVLKNF